MSNTVRLYVGFFVGSDTDLLINDLKDGDALRFSHSHGPRNIAEIQKTFKVSRMSLTSKRGRCHQTLRQKNPSRKLR